MEKSQLRAFVLFLFLLVVMSLSTASFAALSLSPVVPGYAGGMLSSPVGSHTMTAANDGYIKPSIVNVGGKPIMVPATLRMAANAGQYVKNAMRLNPLLLAGTLALPWLIEHGMEWVNGGWQFTSTGYQYYYSADPDLRKFATPELAGQFACTYSGFTYDSMSNPQTAVCFANGNWYTRSIYQFVSNQTVPATDSDWDALPDPLPDLAVELPYAPYMPEGIPVDAPNYDFAPMSVPLGEPYTKPDGSSAQPMAKVSPNGDLVTVDTYDQPLTDSQGQPLTNSMPQDTPEPQPDPCVQNPDRIGCMQAGSDSFEVLRNTVNFDFTPEASPLSGVCPAPISVLGQQLSYQPACDAMVMIRPAVLGMASVMAAFILFGAFREAV